MDKISIGNESRPPKEESLSNEVNLSIHKLELKTNPKTPLTDIENQVFAKDSEKDKDSEAAKKDQIDEQKINQDIFVSFDLDDFEKAIPGKHVLVLTKRYETYKKDLRREYLNEKFLHNRSEAIKRDFQDSKNLYDIRIVEKETDFLDSLPRINALADEYLVIVPDLGEYVIPGEEFAESSKSESQDSNHADNPNNSYPDDESNDSEDLGEDWNSKSIVDESFSSDERITRKKKKKNEQKMEEENSSVDGSDTDSHFSKNKNTDNKIRELFAKLKKKEYNKKKEADKFEGINFDSMQSDIYFHVDVKRL
jgi:hypothetical protein